MKHELAYINKQDFITFLFNYQSILVEAKTIKFKDDNHMNESIFTQLVITLQCNEDQVKLCLQIMSRIQDIDKFCKKFISAKLLYDNNSYEIIVNVDTDTPLIKLATMQTWS
jgi:hypothetical protein